MLTNPVCQIFPREQREVAAPRKFNLNKFFHFLYHPLLYSLPRSISHRLVVSVASLHAWIFYYQLVFCYQILSQYQIRQLHCGFQNALNMFPHLNVCVFCSPSHLARAPFARVRLRLGSGPALFSLRLLHLS